MSDKPRTFIKNGEMHTRMSVKEIRKIIDEVGAVGEEMAIWLKDKTSKPLVAMVVCACALRALAKLTRTPIEVVVNSLRGAGIAAFFVPDPETDEKAH